MATALKHKIRSSRKHQTSSLPIYMFAARAQKKAEARELVLKSRIDLSKQETVTM